MDIEYKPWDEECYNEDVDGCGNFKIKDHILKKFVNKTYDVIRKIDQIGMPEKGEQIRLITMQVFNSISIIKKVADSEVIIHAVFVIFAINKYAAKMIIDLHLQGRIKKATIIVSSIRNAGHVSKSQAVDMLKEYFDIIYVNSHAKIAILETEKGNYYNIEGSGNFSFNGRIEQYVIDNDKAIYDFSKTWIKELMQYKMK